MKRSQKRVKNLNDVFNAREDSALIYFSFNYSKTEKENFLNICSRNNCKILYEKSSKFKVYEFS